MLVTNHDAFGYFADHYGFTVVGTVIPGGDTLAQPGAADLETLVGDIRDHDVPAIFVETTAPARLAEAVAAEVGREISVVELFSDSLGQQGLRRGDLPRAHAHERAAHHRCADPDLTFPRMELLLAPFQSGFTQRGTVAALLVAVTCAVVGVWVVLRGLAFMADALAHGVIPGIAVAALRGFDLTLGAALGAIVTVLGVSLVGARTRLSEDTGIGLLFVGLLATGVMLLSRADAFAVSVTAFLFGDVFGVTWGDVGLQATAAVVALAVSAVLHRAFVALAFDERKAQLLGLRPRLTRALLLALLAMTVVGRVPHGRLPARDRAADRARGDRDAAGAPAAPDDGHGGRPRRAGRAGRDGALLPLRPGGGRLDGRDRGGAVLPRARGPGDPGRGQAAKGGGVSAGRSLRRDRRHHERHADRAGQAEAGQQERVAAGARARGLTRVRVDRSPRASRRRRSDGGRSR